MDYKELEKILGEFGNRIGIPNLSFDEHGYCCLMFDDIVVNIEADSDSETLFLYSNVGDLPSESSPSLYQTLLEKNFLFRGTGGGTLGIDKNTQIIAYAYQIPFKLVTIESFERTLESFVNISEDLTQTINDVLKECESKDVTAQTPPPLGMKV